MEVSMYHQENEELDRLDGVSDPSLVDEHRQRAALVFDQLTIGELIHIPMADLGSGITCMVYLGKFGCTERSESIHTIAHLVVQLKPIGTALWPL